MLGMCIRSKANKLSKCRFLENMTYLLVHVSLTMIMCTMNKKKTSSKFSKLDKKLTVNLDN